MFSLFKINQIIEDDTWYVMQIKNPNGTVKRYTYVDTLPNFDEMPTGEYQITLYDRVNNNFSFKICLLGKAPKVKFETINNNPRVGVVASSGGASTENIVNAVDAMREKGLRGVGAMAVPKTMGSSVSAALATGLKIQGISYSLSSACATSTHCIGHAAELIQLGKADVILAGGSEAEHWTQSCMFDAMGAVSTQYNDTPALASRAYDKDRDGFVIAAGGAMVVVESLEHAQARGANILAEIVGYGASSDGAEMVAPSGEGAVRCMQLALAEAGLESVDYINSHGTSTPLGDVTELKAIAKVFGDDVSQVPAISSTKSMTGHSLGAVGAQELTLRLKRL